jgi:hypothetical protein
MNKYTITKQYYLNLPKEKIKSIFTKIQNSSNDEEFQEEFLQEVVGNLSSAGFVAFFSMIGGGIALFVNPVAGTFILISSIAYGSWLKVCCGRYYRQRQKHIKQSKVLQKAQNILKQRTVKNGSLKIFKKWRTYPSMKFIRTNSAKYGILRLSSNKKNSSKKIYPIQSIKNC